MQISGNLVLFYYYHHHQERRPYMETRDHSFKIKLTYISFSFPNNTEKMFETLCIIPASVITGESVNRRPRAA